MRFLNSAGFFALFLAAPIILLYMLRLHRQNVTVPSIFLWEAVLADRHANRPWQRLRRNWLLFLQLFILLALVLALARPAIPAPMAVHGQVIVLLDASASMQAHLHPAEGGGGARFDAAVRELRGLAATLDSDDRIALIAVGPEPKLLLQSGDAADLRRALDDVMPSDGPADWRAASALAAGLASGDDVTSLLVTDAAIDEALPALPGAVRLMPVSEEIPNVGIVAFSLRRTGEGITAFVRLQNAGPETSRTVALYADGALAERRTISLPTDGSEPLTFARVSVTSWAEVRLEESDAFPLDDRAWVAISGAGSGRALVITPGNRFLVQALRLLPDLALEQSTALAPAEHGNSSDYGLIVVDGPVTATLPTVNLWLIAPDAGTPCGDPDAIFTPTAGVRGQWTNPLLQYVAWDEVHVARARRYTPPPDAEVLLETAVGPLLWIVERPEQRVACLAFDLHDSDLPMRLAFPILTTNLVGWLMPWTSSEPVSPLPSRRPWIPALPPGATEAVLVNPDGTRIPLSPEIATLGGERIGLYRIEAETAAGKVVRYAAVALLDASESDLRPRDFRVGRQSLPSMALASPGWQDLSRRVMLAALGLLLMEAVLWWLPGVRPREKRPALRPAHLKDYVLVASRSVSRLLRGAAFLRVLLVILLVLAFLDVRWIWRTRDLAVVFLLDRSTSTRNAWDAQIAFVEDALAHKSPQDRAALVVFGGDAWVDRPLLSAPELAPIATLPRAEATNIGDAVRLGLALIPDGAPGRLVLLTDGLETSSRDTQPSSSAGVWALREAGARNVDLLVVQAGSGTPGPEVWISDLRLPTRVYPGDRVPVTVQVGSNTRQGLELTWVAAGQAGRGALDAAGEENALAFSFVANEPGFVPLRVCVEPEADTFVQNNCADSWVLVEGAPRVLVVGAAPSPSAGPSIERVALLQALRQAGLTVEEASPGALPLTVQGLADYAGIVLVDTPARDFSPQTLEALRSFVRDLGGGLVAVGGPDSFGVGGWLGTPLEETLPVEMRVQDPQRFPPLAMAVVIDKSGSMGVEEDGIPKIRLAAEAAIRVAETLNDADTLAVVAFDDRPADTLGPVAMAQRDAFIARLQRLQAGGGGIYVRESVTYAAGLLRDAELSPGMQRHLLLLADGSDAEHQEGVMALVENLVGEGMTVSVVAIGAGSDVPFLTQMADRGGGRFYLTQHAADLPAIFAEEAARAKRSYIVEETFYPTPVSSWPPVTGISATPPLRGYVATTPKGAAQVIWEAKEGDPLLAAWQYGLGRSVAWTSDATGRWAAEWVTWDEFARFWGSVVRYVLPPPSDAGLALHILPEDNAARIIADVSAADGSFADALDLQVQVAQSGANTEPQNVTLSQTAPGRYEGRFLLPDRAGALLLRLHGDRSLTAGWSVPASPEYLPADAGAAVARLTAQSGAVLTDDPAAVFVHNLHGRGAGQPLGSLLVLLAAVLWPVDIAWRRLSLTRADVKRAWLWLRGRVERRRRVQPRPAPTQPKPTLASALRQRRRAVEKPAESSVPERASAGEVILPAEPEIPEAPLRQAPQVQPSTPDDDETLAARLKRHVRH